MTTESVPNADIDSLLQTLATRSSTASSSSEDKKKLEEERKKRRNAAMADGKKKREKFLTGEVDTPKLQDSEKPVAKPTEDRTSMTSGTTSSTPVKPILSSTEIACRRVLVCVLSFYVAFCILRCTVHVTECVDNSSAVTDNSVMWNTTFYLVIYFSLLQLAFWMFHQKTSAISQPKHKDQLTKMFDMMDKASDLAVLLQAVVTEFAVLWVSFCLCIAFDKVMQST